SWAWDSGCRRSRREICKRQDGDARGENKRHTHKRSRASNAGREVASPLSIVECFHIVEVFRLRHSLEQPGDARPDVANLVQRRIRGRFVLKDRENYALTVCAPNGVPVNKTLQPPGGTGVGG